MRHRRGRPVGVAARRALRAALGAVVVSSLVMVAAVGLDPPASVAAPQVGSAPALWLAPPAPHSVPTSVAPIGTDVAVSDARHPSISGDGRWVVFDAVVDGRRSAFRTDRVTGTTLELTPVPEGVRAGDTVRPVVSADGCVVAAHTEMALDLFRDDDRGDRWDVYRSVVPECGGELGRWELVSTGADGSSRDDVVPDAAATLNASGTLVAYVHPTSEWRGAGRGPSTITNVSVVDLAVPLGSPNRTMEVPVLPAEAPTSAYRYRGIGEPALSGDGRYLAFTADVTAADLLPSWGPGAVSGEAATRQVYLWDREDDDRSSRVRLVSGREGVPAERGATSPVVSVDGRVVAFVSSDPGLVDAVASACAEDCPTQVLRWERAPDGAGEGDDATLTLVSAVEQPGGIVAAGDAPSWSPALDRGGHQVTFVTRATNLLVTWVPLGSGEQEGDVIVAEIGTAQLRRATDVADVSGARAPVVASHARPSVSATGRVVVFETADPAAFGPAGAIDGRGVVGVTATPRLSLADVDFGTVLTGWAGDELYVSVLNEGPGAFAPSVITSTSSAFRVVPGGSCTRGLIVPAGASCTVHLTFNPTRPVSFAGVLTVEESDDELRGPPAPPPDLPAEIDSVSVAAALSGAGGDPVLRMEPAGIDLGPARVGGVGGRRAIDVRNIGGGPTEIVAIGLAGQAPGEFVVTAESCTGRALNRNATCTVELELRPTAAARRTATLTATTVTGEYAAAIVSGDGRFEPVLNVATESVRAGGVLGIGVAGFPADSDVTVSFEGSLEGSSDGSPPGFATVRTDADGGLLAEVTVPRRARSGDRTLVASGPGGLVAVATVRVERADPTPAGLPGHGLG